MTARYLFDLFHGFVSFEAEGGLPERLLNLLRDEKIETWRLRRSQTKLTACCRARDYRRLRPFARRTGMRLHHTEKHGLPFLLHRYRARLGIPIGAVGAALLLWWLSGRIWIVTVVGADVPLAASVCDTLEPLGVRVGAASEALQPTKIQLEALERIPEITWLSVNMKGCTAEICVTKREVGGPEPQTIRASNLVAARDGVIVRLEVRSGQKEVQVGEGVTEGTLLVSGVVDTTVGPMLKRAEATVLADTTRQHVVVVPLTQTAMLPTGKRTIQSELLCFGMRIPLYTSMTVSQPYTLTETEFPLTVHGVALPLGIGRRVYTPIAPTSVTYTREEAEAEAQKQLLAWEEQELEAVTVRERRCEGEVRDGAYVLTATYACTEDIASEQPLLFTSDE